MAKKNSRTTYTPNIQNVGNKIIRFKEIIFAISAIIVAILNLWLSAQLAPLAQDISDLRHQVRANEVHIKNNESTCSELKNDIFGELKYLRGRIDEVYNLIK